MICKFFRCYWYFFLIFYFNFFTAITFVCFWLRKVDLEVIIKNKSVLGRFLCLDILLFALLFLIVKIVHFLYVQIYLKILCISFQKELICLMIASLSAGETRHCIVFHVYLFHQFCQQQKSGPFSYAYYRPFWLIANVAKQNFLQTLIEFIPFTKNRSRISFFSLDLGCWELMMQQRFG